MCEWDKKGFPEWKIVEQVEIKDSELELGRIFDNAMLYWGIKWSA